MKILIVGVGYVGNALGDFLSKKYDVTGFDIDETKQNKNFNILVNPDLSEYDTFFLCLPTSYSKDIDGLDTTIISNTISDILSVNKDCDIYIKSTVPIGFASQISTILNYDRIFVVPEFLREKHAEGDISSPSRIVIGGVNKEGINKYLDIFKGKNIPTIICTNEEAEAIKLFSNAYLANRVAFFNEVDTFSELNKLNSSKIINGICLDPRIGNFYNKPSYGYGGYCLPKDSQELAKSFKNIPQSIVGASINANNIRKKHIVSMISAKLKNVDHPLVGVYKLAKRNSPLDDIMMMLSDYDIGVLLYEPSINQPFYLNALLCDDLDEFKKKSDLILTESDMTDLSDVKDKIYFKAFSDYLN